MLVSCSAVREGECDCASASSSQQSMLLGIKRTVENVEGLLPLLTEEKAQMEVCMLIGRWMDA